MAGHSHWAGIKHKKGKEDAKRGKIFSRLAKQIMTAVRLGGKDPDTNLDLRYAMDAARAANMPKDNIERAIKRGTGELKGESLEEMLYEGYAPNGIALLLATLTDNRNRAVADIRRILTRYGGKLAETGAVSYLFEQQGFISAEAGEQDPEELALMAIDQGAVDVNIDDSTLEVYTEVKGLQKVKEALEAEGMELNAAELTMIPISMTELDEADTFKVMRIIEALEELDDVQQVYTNLFLTPELVIKYEEMQA